jgi:DNA uptake protein ComE-like DNA-binding protein
VILLSLILVIAAAVLLVVGVFQDGLLLIYLSIASCLAAMALLGVGVLLRRQQGTGELVAAGPGVSPATATAGVAPAAPAVTGRRVEAPRPVEHEDATDRAAERTETTRVRPVTDDRDGVEDPSAGGADTVAAPRSGTAVPAPVAKKAAVRKVAVKKATAKRAVVKKAAVRKVAVREAGTPTAVDAPTAGGPAARGAELPEVKGLGPAKREALLARFGDADGVRQASVDDLTEVRGIGPALARAIKDAVG